MSVRALSAGALFVVVVVEYGVLFCLVIVSSDGQPASQHKPPLKWARRSQADHDVVAPHPGMDDLDHYSSSWRSGFRHGFCALDRVRVELAPCPSCQVSENALIEAVYHI